MKKNIRSALKYTLWTVVAVLLLYFSFRGVNWKDFGDALRACRWEWIIFSMALGVVVLYIRGLRWQMLLRPIDPSTRVVSCFNAMNICMLVNLVLPRVGEVVRCGFITKNSARDREGKKLATVDKVLGTVVVDRAWDALSVLIILVLVLIFLQDRFGAFFKGTFLSGLGGIAALWWAAALLLGAGAAFIWLCYRLKDRGRIWAKVWNIITGLWDGLRSGLHMKNAWLFFLYTALIWVGYWLMSAAVVWSLADINPADVGPELAASIEKVRSLDMADALLLMFVGALSTIIPVPGGFGAFHTVVAGAITSIYGLPFGVGLIFATLSHESQVITDALCGLVSYGVESVRKEV
jgi:hypothetical protein